MDKEKILTFLNFEPNKSIDKFTMKLFVWFNVSFSLFIILGGLLVQIFDNSLLNVIFVVFSLVTNIIFFISIRFIKTQVNEWFHHLIVVLFTLLTLLYGWFVFSQWEALEYCYPKFTWMHVAVLIAGLVLGLYLVIKIIWVFCLLKTNTIKQAREKLQKKLPVWIPIVSGCSPMVLVRLLKGPFNSMGLGIGFAFWGLMCIWMIFLLAILPKIYIIFKYKVNEWFEVVDDANN